jgi:U4/U6.U5 tri-snRNP-associated protein 1
MDSFSIEETNKIRAAIGLKPLPVPGSGPTFKAPKPEGHSEEEDAGSTLESRQAQGYDNWKKLQNDADAKAQREAKNEAIKKARDAARKYSKLEGKGLGEADETTELDTKTWLLQQKKRQKKIERERLQRLEKELAEREQVPEHTAADLAGVKVGHELESFEVGGEQILTLKDSTIDQNEEEGDELENFEMREREALKERLEFQKKKPVYNPNEVDEDGDKSLLKQYDETIDGKKRKLFTLDGQGTSGERRNAMDHIAGEESKFQSISLGILNDVPVSDYAVATEPKIRKPKKNKPKSTRKRPADDDDTFDTSGSILPLDGNKMEVDSAHDTRQIPHMTNLDNVSFVDDDDLQASLAVQRRAALQRKKRKPEDIARQLRAEASTPGLNDRNGVDLEGVGLVIDETSEFIANLQRPTEEDKPRSGSSKDVKPKSTGVSNQKNDNQDVDMDQSYSDIDESEEVEGRLKRENSTPAAPALSGTGLDEEFTLNKGVGAALSLLTQRGLMQPSHDGDLNALHRERQRFLAEKQRREAEAERKARLQRERDRASGKLDRMSARDREEYARWENKQRDQQESRQTLELFNREYKPDVQLKYTDQFGRALDPKEAFKELSHQFHGKGSGKQKTEKLLKKIADDKRRMAMSSLDSSQATGMNNAMGATAKKNRQAGVRLA